MKLNEDTYERIENYLAGLLSHQERKTFEDDLEASVELQEQLEQQKLLRLSIEEQGLRNTLEKIHKEQIQPAPKVIPLRSRSWTKYAVAAVVGALLIWGGLNFSRKQSANQSLFASNFTPDPGLPTTMSSSNNFEFFEAMVSYKQGDYQKAISAWEKLVQTKPKNDTLNYFLGVAHLANDNEEEAITFLQWTIEQEDSKFLPYAYYYLGLAHLKGGDAERAKQVLTLSETNLSKKLLNSLLSKK